MKGRAYSTAALEVKSAAVNRPSVSQHSYL